VKFRVGARVRPASSVGLWASRTATGLCIWEMRANRSATMVNTLAM